MPQPHINFQQPMKVNLPGDETGDHFMLPKFEWVRMREGVDRLKNPIAFASGWSQTFAGAFLGSLVALIAMLTTEPRPSTFALVFIGNVTGSCLVLAAFMYFVHKQDRRRHQDQAVILGREMDDVYVRCAGEAAPKPRGVTHERRGRQSSKAAISTSDQA